MEKNVILIMTDLEGISGVDSIDDVLGAGYPAACERLISDTNAAVAGAFAGGADEVLVIDGHGNGKNFPAGKLDPRAEQVQIFADTPYMTRVTGYVAVGAHAMPGTIGGFLDHVQSAVSWYNYYVNGRRSGELAQGAIYAGLFGAPCVAVTGDKAACAEGRAFFGDVAAAEVKTAVCRNRARSLPREEAERLIFEAARAGAGRVGRLRPYRPRLPMEILVEFSRTDYAEEALERHPDAERVDARTVRRVLEEIRGYSDLLM